MLSKLYQLSLHLFKNINLFLINSLHYLIVIHMVFLLFIDHFYYLLTLFHNLILYFILSILSKIIKFNEMY